MRELGNGDDGHREADGELEVEAAVAEDEEAVLQQDREERQHEGGDQKQEGPQDHRGDPQDRRLSQDQKLRLLNHPPPVILLLVSLTKECRASYQYV